MLEFLRRKYPFNNNLIHNAKIIFFVSIALTGFLYFFQPFDLNSFPTKQKLFFSASIGMITFTVLSFNLLVLPSYFTKVFNNEKWTVLKEIIWDTWLITSISIAYIIFLNVVDIQILKGVFIIKVILLSVVPISLLVIFNRNRLLKLNLNDALELNKKLMQKLRNQPHHITFYSDYNETLTIDPEKIILIRSAGNYVEIFFENNDKATKKMLRSPLKRVEEALEEYAFIYKTHRSYLVNVNYIVEAEGNSQGIKLTLRLLDFKVPVSRNYIAKLKELL